MSTRRHCQFVLTLFLLSGLVTDPSFMWISSLVLELWYFPFIRDWTETRKLEISPSEVCFIYGDSSQDIKSGTDVSNKMLVYAAKFHGYNFCHFWVIKGKPTGVAWGLKLLPHPDVEYVWIYLNKQSSAYARILNFSDAVHSFRSLVQITEELSWQSRIQSFVKYLRWSVLQLENLLFFISIIIEGNTKCYCYYYRWNN